MKIKIQQYLFVFISLMGAFAFGQVQVGIQNMTYLSGGSISNCGTIDFEGNSSITVQFGVELKKPYNMVVGDGAFRIKTKKTASSSDVERLYQAVPSVTWSGSQPDEFWYASLSVTLSAQDFNASGGVFFAEYESSSSLKYTSCNYSLEKDELPSFSLSPTSTTVSCGSTSSKTFTVSSVNIPNGSTVQYQWNVGSGWLYNGNAVSSFTTTTPSVQLVPNQYPPSNVRVTPVLNGTNYPQLMCNVGLSSFNPSYQISGSSYVCDAETYTVNNLSSNVSIQSVASSNPNVATAVLNSDGSIAVTKVSDGDITLSVVLQNTCSQTATITKSIQVGIPASAMNATISGNTSICSGQSYTYVLSGANHPCINSIVWEVSSNLQIVSQSATSITVSKNPFSTDYAGQITASIPGSSIEIVKGVWVGTPNTNGLSIQKLSAPDLKVGEWAQLKASYIPLSYVSNGSLDVTYDWQIPNSAIIDLTDTAYKNIRPNSSGSLTIGVRVQCECGYGDWKYRTFDVTGGSGSGTGPIDLIPAD